MDLAPAHFCMPSGSAVDELKAFRWTLTSPWQPLSTWSYRFPGRLHSPGARVTPGLRRVLAEVAANGSLNGYPWTLLLPVYAALTNQVRPLPPRVLDNDTIARAGGIGGGGGAHTVPSRLVRASLGPAEQDEPTSKRGPLT